jgi:hypothetical protein
MNRKLLLLLTLAACADESFGAPPIAGRPQQTAPAHGPQRDNPCSDHGIIPEVCRDADESTGESSSGAPTDDERSSSGESTEESSTT